MQNMSLYSGRDGGGGGGGQASNPAQQAMYATHHGNHLVSGPKRILLMIQGVLFLIGLFKKGLRASMDETC